MSSPIADPVKKILSNIKKDEKGCWIYTGYTNKDGYGVISNGSGSKRKFLRCHRVMYEHFIEYVSNDLSVCHDCDTPACCNPEHLFVGTQKDNVHDMIRKGRKPITYGEKSYNYKLSEEQVKEIRENKGTLLEIAGKYGIAKSHVSMIKNFKTRKYG